MPDALDILRKKARSRDFEVEDLFRCARYPDGELAAGIDRLASELSWEFGASHPNIPWREWAYVVAEYCRGGFPRLVEIGRHEQFFRFVVALLDEIGGNEALRVLVEVADPLLDHPERDTAAAQTVAAALNALCLRKEPNAEPSSVNGDKIKMFLHRLLQGAKSDAECGTVLYALRYFGDESSLVCIEAVPEMSPHWDGARAAAKKAILKRRRQARMSEHL
jgi:hypothetical protein